MTLAVNGHILHHVLKTLCMSDVILLIQEVNGLVTVTKLCFFIIDLVIDRAKLYNISRFRAIFSENFVFLQPK